jgi:hypothetical protein
MKRGYTPLSPQKLTAELAAMGFTKWKSCGRTRYRNLQLWLESIHAPKNSTVVLGSRDIGRIPALAAAIE